MARKWMAHPPKEASEFVPASGEERPQNSEKRFVGFTYCELVTVPRGVGAGALMGNASQQRLEISEHTGGEVNAPGQQAGEGKFRLVRMKGLANFQEFLVALGAAPEVLRSSSSAGPECPPRLPAHV